MCVFPLNVSFFFYLSEIIKTTFYGHFLMLPKEKSTKETSVQQKQKKKKNSKGNKKYIKKAHASYTSASATQSLSSSCIAQFKFHTSVYTLPLFPLAYFCLYFLHSVFLFLLLSCLFFTFFFFFCLLSLIICLASCIFLCRFPYHGLFNITSTHYSQKIVCMPCLLHLATAAQVENCNTFHGNEFFLRY